MPLPHVEETITFIREAMKMPTPPDGFAVTTAMGMLIHLRESSRRTAYLNTHILIPTGQRYLGDPHFEPVWEELDKLSSVIFIHPADTVMPPTLGIGPCEYSLY